ncbi:tetracycline regulation of excision, RteC [Mucilaginibacter terrenus]|uniref:Tetracycline regulation of excision, RteC n=1 Tax=Mucilaginibacter terrenus TaxID=2482727 RepID=A0A3E2NVQ2_9SPHI|nr:RteC domain-containing protein [Mucilaginibacter terrenus]RFZ85093.1 tetracycline regulation of excision, RteC [Mucilaginibacter terrenus]
MRTITERYYSALENQLNEISTNGEPLAEKYKASIILCKKAMAKLKSYISSYSFESVEDEIHFFKEVKPQFYSKYIYFISVYNYLMKRPTGAEDHLKEYINSELADLKRYFDHNGAFYQYYRSGSTQMDEVYFTRGGFDVHVELEKFEEDEVYSTSHDYKLSNIIANEKYQDFLNIELQKLNNHDERPLEMSLDLPLTWTFSKTDLIELIYALVAAGVFNNGNAEIKSVVSFFQTVFHIDLGQYYHKYTDITRRKKDRTLLLDKLKLALLRKMDQKLDEDGSIQQKLKL